MKRIGRVCAGVCFLLVIGGGCAGNTKTVQTETTAYPASEPPVVERQTTVTTTETEAQGESGGVVSGTVNILGEIIALPFRLVGGLLRVLF